MTFNTPFKHKSFFQVGNKRFDNNVDALAHFSKNPNDILYFGLDYDFLNPKNFHIWKKEPKESIDFYKKKFIDYLNNKYLDIILMYSGGTDSQTILDAFIKNNIKNINLYSFMYESVLKSQSRFLIQKDFVDAFKSDYQSIVKKLNYNVFGVELGVDDIVFPTIDEKQWIKLLENHYRGDWNSNVVLPINFLEVEYGSNSFIFKNKKHSCIIDGREKPNIVINDGWWCWQLHSGLWQETYMPIHNDAELIHFYFSDQVPELQIKLAWLKIKEIEKIIKENNWKINKNTVSKIQSKESVYYQRINHAMGYKALTPLLDSNLNKDNGHLFKNWIDDKLSYHKEKNLDHVNKEYFEHFVLPRVNERFLNVDQFKVDSVYSLPIPIKPIG